MATAGDLITRALRSLGVIGDGESPTANQYADGLVALNDLLSSWATDRLTVYRTVRETFALTGAASYSIGPGETFDTVRPIKVDFAFLTLSGIDYPMGWLTREQFNEISDKMIPADVACVYYYDADFPAATLHLWPAPAGGTLTLDSWKPLTAFSSTSDDVTLPPGYERALRFNLAVDLMPEYQVENARVAGLAKESLAGIKRANSAPVMMAFDLAIPQRSSFNVMTGEV